MKQSPDEVPDYLLILCVITVLIVLGAVAGIFYPLLGDCMP